MASPGDLQLVDVILTAGCNLRCGYCYQNDKKPRSMDWDTLRASADLLVAARASPKCACSSSAASRCSSSP